MKEFLVSVVVPTFNGAMRICRCLDALTQQSTRAGVEVIVVDDGSTDDTGSVVERYGHSSVRLLTQANAGPAAARNRGVASSRGAIVLFTDDDCEPTPNWLDAMLLPFEDMTVGAVKGAYRTRQRSLLARFVQIEYEDRYRRMEGLSNIDFVDTYSAAFRRERFLEMGGYDTSFPVACAEDADLSYRMAARGCKMKFAPRAIVYHTHPGDLWSYLRKKYKFAFWRVFALQNTPEKAVSDSHTPQLMKFQMLLPLALVVAFALDLTLRPPVPVSLEVLTIFFLTTIPFSLRAAVKDLVVGMLSPLLLAARAFAQFSGVSAGLLAVFHNRFEAEVDSA